jgi:hypothetical protein
MRSKTLHYVLISSLSVLVLAGMAFAKSKQIDVIYKTTIGNSLELTPGTYRMTVRNNAPSPKVAFFNRDGKLVGQVHAKVVSESSKNSQTEVDYTTLASNKHVITEISPGGWNENLLFTHPGMKKSTMNQ